MTNHAILAALLVTGVLASCSKTDTPGAASPSPAEQTHATAAEPQMSPGEAAMDACKLLRPEEIASIQGEAPAKNQLVGRSEGGLAVSQCNYLLPTGFNSMAVRVVERGSGPKARDPKAVWQETFHNIPPHVAAAEKARKPQKIDGVGDEAFWLGDVKAGGLHVLKGHRYIRISVGGKENLETKIEKSRKLAELVLPRLDAQQ